MGLKRGLADDLPESPGVYRFYGEDGALLYVGKAGSLRRRVQTYFSERDFGYDAERLRAMAARMRRNALMRLQQRIALAHNRAAVGTIEPVIIDSVAADGTARGRRRAP